MSLRQLPLVPLLLLVAFLALVAGCGAGSGGGGDEDQNAPPGGGQPPPPPPPNQGTTTLSSIVPSGTIPPVGVTFHIGFVENVSRASMQSFFASMVAANSAIWQISEGQVRIDKVRFFDNLGPGVTASQFTFGLGNIDTSNIDILVWQRFGWDIPAAGAVSASPGQGRNDRIMIVPSDANTFVLIHECSHFFFRLTWPVGPLLVDEYQDGIQDQACVMESEKQPQRWCSDFNHTSQSSQPHSCWRQILADYAGFSHSGTDTASDLPPAPTAEYNDTP